MTNKDATQEIERIAELLDSLGHGIEGDELIEAAQALREPGWISTADRLPTEAEADKDGYVFTTDGKSMDVNKWKYVKLYPEVTHWMPLPPMPEVEG